MPKGTYRRRLELQIEALKIRLATEIGASKAKKPSIQSVEFSGWGPRGNLRSITHSRCGGPMKICQMCSMYSWVFPLRCAGDCAHDCVYEIQRYGRRSGGEAD